MLQHLHLHLHCASDLIACIGDNQTDQEDRQQFNCHLTSTLKQQKFFTVIKRPGAKYTVFQHFQLYIIVRGCFIGVLNLILQEPAKQCVTNQPKASNNWHKIRQQSLNHCLYCLYLSSYQWIQKVIIALHLFHILSHHSLIMKWIKLICNLKIIYTIPLNDNYGVLRKFLQMQIY